MDYGKAIRLQPRCSDAYVNIAYSFQAQKMYAKALEMFNSVLAMDPQFTPALEGRAILYLMLHHPMGAIIDITHALVRAFFLLEVPFSSMS